MIVYTRKRRCVHCKHDFNVDPKRPTARICVPCAEKHSDKRVRERLTRPQEQEPAAPPRLAFRMPHTEWRDRARCRTDADPELFYPAGREGYANLAQIEVAKQFCRSCPVRKPCLAEALARGDDWGIWGGRTPAERRQLARRQVLAEQFPPVAELALELPGVRDRQRHPGRKRVASC